MLLCPNSTNTSVTISFSTTNPPDYPKRTLVSKFRMKYGPSSLLSFIQSTKLSRLSTKNILSGTLRFKETINPSHHLVAVFGKVTTKLEQITGLSIKFSSFKNGLRQKMRLKMIWLNKIWWELKGLTKRGLLTLHKCLTLTLSFYTSNLSSFTPWFLLNSTICTNNLRNKTDVSNLLKMMMIIPKGSFSKRKLLKSAKSLSDYLAVSKIASVLVICL